MGGIPVRQNLEGQQFQKALPSYLDKLRKDSGLEILDEKLKAKPEEADTKSAGSAAEPADKAKSK